MNRQDLPQDMVDSALNVRMGDLSAARKAQDGAGKAIQQTLDLLKGDLIASVAILDEGHQFVKGLNANSAAFSRDTVVSDRKLLTVFRTLRDTDGQVQGFVEIQFSKRSFIRSINRFKIFIWIAGAAMLAAVAILGYLISNNIVLPLNRSVQMLQDLASGEGDLTKRLALASQDEVGTQARWINIFIEKLQSMVGEIKTDAEKLNSISSILPAVA
jgi:methyl-accepting chemotaxis protein